MLLGVPVQDVIVIFLAIIGLQLFALSSQIKNAIAGLNESLAEIRTTLDEVTEAVESVDRSVTAVQTAVESLND